MPYVRWLRLTEAPTGAAETRSPLVFIHGFPDSPAMFMAYTGAAEADQPWRQGRACYAVEFPNRHHWRVQPPWWALATGALTRDFEAALRAVIARSPTGRIIVIAHDWGATYTWALVRRHPALPIERMVSLSVGASFRYDLAEHGARAVNWLYALVFAIPYYVPAPAVRRAVAALIVHAAGYHSPTAPELYHDCYHYWAGPFQALAWPWRALGLGARPPFTEFSFPVLFVRAPPDRLAPPRPLKRRWPSARIANSSSWRAPTTGFRNNSPRAS